MKNNAFVKLTSLHKKQFIKLAGITFAFLFLIVILALAPANALDITKYMGHGIGGNVFNDYESECAWNYSYLHVSEGMYKEGSSKPIYPGPSAFVEVGIDDYCIGAYRWGYAEIELDSFVVSRSLESLEAEGIGTLYWISIDCWWYPCPFPDEEKISIKLKITGEVGVMNGANTFRSYGNGKRTIIHYSGTTRLGTASGLIKGETFEMEIKPVIPEEPPPPEPGQQYPNLPYTNADIGRFNNIQISVTK